MQRHQPVHNIDRDHKEDQSGEKDEHRARERTDPTTAPPEGDHDRHKGKTEECGNDHFAAIE
jgi:hypothetical protein